jgi:hypothetical protein
VYLLRIFVLPEEILPKEIIPLVELPAADWNLEAALAEATPEEVEEQLA